MNLDVLLNAENEVGILEEIAEKPNKIERIRMLSNVIQALDNLAIQCAAGEGMDRLLEFAQNQKFIYSDLLRREIHLIDDEEMKPN